MTLKLKELNSLLAVCKLDPKSEIPSWVLTAQAFFSITRTDEELSIVCEQSHVPLNIKSERDWKALKVIGPLDFSLTGVLAAIANPLADRKISIFALSTFDTDYILIKNSDLSAAKNALIAAGFLLDSE